MITSALPNLDLNCSTPVGINLVQTSQEGSSVLAGASLPSGHLNHLTSLLHAKAHILELSMYTGLEPGALRGSTGGYNATMLRILNFTRALVQWFQHSLAWRSQPLMSKLTASNYLLLGCSGEPTPFLPFHWPDSPRHPIVLLLSYPDAQILFT